MIASIQANITGSLLVITVSFIYLTFPFLNLVDYVVRDVYIPNQVEKNSLRVHTLSVI